MVLTNLDGLTLVQIKALAIIPHITGTLSFLGSSSILYDILWARKRNLPQPYGRLLLSISTVDVITSAAFGLSTWPIPRGTEGVWGAVGTTQTCTAQGFFGQLMLGSPFYNMMLAIYYLLIGKYNLSEEEMTQRYEPYMHLVAIVPPVALAVAGLPLHLYNNANIWCSVSLAPNSDAHDEQIHAAFNIISAVILWVIISVVTVTMIMLTTSIRTEEKKFIELKRKNDSNSTRGRDVPANLSTDLSPPTNLERSRKMLYQAMFYLGAFYLTWWAPTVNRIVQLISGKNHFFFVLATVTLLPLQGFLNFLVYRSGPCIA